MATGYKALLALGESHTKSVESTVQAALAQKKLKDEQRRKQQEEQERKQRELEAKLRLRYFEEQKRKAEAEARKDEDRKAKEAELLRREAEQRDTLRYGPKKAKAGATLGGKWPTSDSGVREEVRRKRVPDNDDDGDAGSMLTREEKRERKMQAELKRAFNAPRRPVGNATHKKPGAPGRRLAGGGALNIVNNPSDVTTGGTGNVKERLAAMPNTLTRLNTVKRDTRTIDEIVRDRRENKDSVLNGDQARNFDDWFTPSSRAKKEKASVPSSSDEALARGQKAHTPMPSSSASSSSSRPSSQPIPAAAPRRTPLPMMPTPKPKQKVGPSASTPMSAIKKRPRSLSASRSVSPPLKRTHLAPGSSKSASSSTKAKSTSSRSHSPRGGPSVSSLSEEIWGLFGKNKAAYLARDVLSDSEDDDAMMEADASALEREEKYSARVARKEEREAEEEERRREEEKRRRKAGGR